jgi:hypothetical protein
VPEISLAVGRAVWPDAAGKAVAVGAAMTVVASTAKAASVYFMMLVVKKVFGTQEMMDVVLVLLDVVMGGPRRAYILLPSESHSGRVVFIFW